MDLPAHPIAAFAQWFPPEDWEDDYAAFMDDFAEQYDQALERPLDEDVDALPDEERAILSSAIAKRFLAEYGGDLVNDFQRDHPDAAPEMIAILQELANTDPGVYEVIEAKPGSHYVLQDQLNDEPPITLPQEHMASGTYVQWDLLLGRMLRGDQKALSFPALVIPREYVFDLRAMKTELEAGLTEDNPDLPGSDRPGAVAHLIEEVLLNVWLAATVNELQDSAVQNIDGDAVEIVSLAYPIKGNPEQVAAILGKADDFKEHQPMNWMWLQAFKGGQTAHAHLRLEGSRLLAECNSGKRGKKLSARLEKLLGSRLGKPLKMKGDPVPSTPLEPIESALESLDPEQRAEVEAQLTAQLLEHHWLELDQVVPMIEGKPRKLAQTEEGRARVVNWLKFLENTHARSQLLGPKSALDLSPLWSELGLLAYRNAP